MTTETVENRSLMNGAIRVIIAEHGGVWRVLDILEQLQTQMNLHDEAPDEVLIGTILDYLEKFSQRIHRSGEDVLLYSLLVQRHPDAKGLIDKQIQDHVVGADRIPQLRLLLNDCARHYPQGRDELSKQLSKFTFALRKHIKREEGIVVPLARQHLLDSDWEAIVNSKDQMNDPLFGSNVREEFSVLRSRIVSMTPTGMGGLGIAHAHLQQPFASIASDNSAPKTLLEIKDLTSHYGRIQALHGISIEIKEGELVALVGANGAGKSTLLRTISGIQPMSGGSINFNGQDLAVVSADKRVFAGISQVPEGRQVFGPMSVEDNIRLGAYSRKDSAEIAADMEKMYDLFPILRQKCKQAAGTLSGGQQQMLAMARALMVRPKLLLLDEPSMGLAPLLIEEIFNVVKRLKKEGMTIFLVEQNAAQALSLADRGYVLETGHVVLSGPGKVLLNDDKVKAAYLGM
ncbi:branched-chain amino acid transport system ATP-binding protein [Oceanospirillum multiglobuliferum]|nr:branched-chain amino acid transport system ATP-binding protein [Oceanospirillum multiglobuliferum]